MFDIFFVYKTTREALIMRRFRQPCRAQLNKRRHVRGDGGQADNFILFYRADLGTAVVCKSD